MMTDKSISVGGDLPGVANTGDNVQISVSNQSCSVVEELCEIAQQLNIRYPALSQKSKINAFEIELQQKLIEKPELKQRLLGALQSGSVELLKVLTNNPFVAVSTETVRGWLEAE